MPSNGIELEALGRRPSDHCDALEGFLSLHCREVFATGAKVALWLV